MAQNDIVFSGIQPTGTLHVGNYFGALKQWIDLQKDYTCMYCVVDLHALTVKQNPKTFSRQTLDAATDLLALGVDPEKSTLFVQSHVPEHTELSWIFSTLTPVGELERMTQYKEKARRHTANVNTGLLTYPILMASDILLYKGTLVPVGEDQVQHVELARVIARKFNAVYGETFPEPKTKLTKSARIMSLTDPTKKMSKSHGEKTYVALTDDPKTIEKKIGKAVTATSGGKRMDAGVANLFTILREISDTETIREYENLQHAGKIRYAEMKKHLADALAQHLEQFRERRRELTGHPERIREILDAGRTKALIVAKQTMEEAREKIGLLR
jgi:tryptophanyl-tRNA synthetase